MEHVSSPTVADICEAIGRETIAKAVGVGLTAISNAVVENRFPARWFAVIESLCDANGLPCPRCLFNFAGFADRGAVCTPQGKLVAAVQQ